MDSSYVGVGAPGQGVPGRLIPIPDGPDGIRVTLAWMRRYIRTASRDPYMKSLAEQIAGDNGSREKARLIHQWVRENIPYVPDPGEIEFISMPQEILRQKDNPNYPKDCDDHVIVTGTLLSALGVPVRLVAIAFEPDRFTHVFLQALFGNNVPSNWLSSDTTERHPFGWQPGTGDDGGPIAVARMTMRV